MGLVTSAFLHDSVMHLFVNMLALYMFGSDVERTLGPLRYLGLYLAAVVSASLPQLIVVSATAAAVPYPTGMLGAALVLRLARRRAIDLDEEPR